MFSPYSPAFDSDVGTLPCPVLAELAVRSVTALFVLAAPCKPDEHAVIQIIIITTTVNKPRATVFFQSRGSLLNSLSISYSFFSILPRLSLFPDFPFRNGHLRGAPFSQSSAS